MRLPDRVVRALLSAFFFCIVLAVPMAVGTNEEEAAYPSSKEE